MEINLPEEIKKIRHELGLSQRELGEMLNGRNRDHIKDIENGRKKLTAEDYLKINKIYNKHTAPPGDR